MPDKRKFNVRNRRKKYKRAERAPQNRLPLQNMLWSESAGCFARQVRRTVPMAHKPLIRSEEERSAGFATQTNTERTTLRSSANCAAGRQKASFQPVLEHPIDFNP